MNAKTIASYVSTAALLAAVWFVGKALVNGAGLDACFANVGGACLLSIACSVWNPPASPAAK